jgi:hypothetical protein
MGVFRFVATFQGVSGPWSLRVKLAGFPLGPVTILV